MWLCRTSGEGLRSTDASWSTARSMCRRRCQIKHAFLVGDVDVKRTQDVHAEESLYRTPGRHIIVRNQDHFGIVHGDALKRQRLEGIAHRAREIVPARRLQIGRFRVYAEQL